MILRRHKLEMPSFDVRACHHLGHANHYTNQQICIVLRAIGLLVWVLLNRVQSWRVTSRLIVCDGLWWFVEYRTIFSQSLEVVDTSRLIHRISLNLSLDVLNPAPQRILLPDSLSLSLSLSLNFTQAIISLATYALLTVRNSLESVCKKNISRTCAEDKDNTSWETGPKQGPLISLPVQIFHKIHITFINS